MRPTTKWCPKCATAKPRSQFFRNAGRADGLSGWCKKCWYPTRKAWREAGGRGKENYASKKRGDTKRWASTRKGALALIRSANERTAKRGGTLLDPEIEAPKIMEQLDAGFFGIPYDREPGPRTALSPSLSRIDHTNPDYVGNYVVEPWAINAFRGSGSHVDLISLVDTLEAAHPDGIAGFLKFGGERWSH